MKASSPKPCRLLIDEPTEGAWNMALDEALLESAAANGQCTLRFYRWIEPTLSLGYFQHHKDRQSHKDSLSCTMVRRSTGGGAILHDRELTYSFILPTAQSLALAHDVCDAKSLYLAIHEGLITALSFFGLSTRLCEQSSGLCAREEPFLCFQRRTLGDVLLGKSKIAGSAQRRRGNNRGAILQHGSILLGTSVAAPQLPGIEQLTGVRIDPHELARRLIAVLADRLRLTLDDGQPTAKEQALSKELVKNKFGYTGWTASR